MKNTKSILFSLLFVCFLFIGSAGTIRSCATMSQQKIETQRKGLMLPEKTTYSKKQMKSRKSKSSKSYIKKQKKRYKRSRR